ncbi:MAG: hypothetical protein J6W60_10060 [Treponema sp.]|nr:hypothetical protein [Treponema sp.]
MNKKRLPVFLASAFFLAFFANNLYAQESTELTIYDLMQIDEPEQETVQEKEVETVPEDNQNQDQNVQQETKSQDKKDSTEYTSEGEDFVFMPDLTPSIGYPETFAVDLGGDCFWKIKANIYSGVYTLLEWSESSDNNFIRLAVGGSSIWFNNFGIIQVRLGGGLGAMPEDKKLLLTAFAEATVRLLVLDFKFIYEFPLGPEDLKTYYNDHYSPFKFRVGLAHMLFLF